MYKQLAISTQSSSYPILDLKEAYSFLGSFIHVLGAIPFNKFFLFLLLLSQSFALPLGPDFLKHQDVHFNAHGRHLLQTDDSNFIGIAFPLGLRTAERTQSIGGSTLDRKTRGQLPNYFTFLTDVSKVKETYILMNPVGLISLLNAISRLANTNPIPSGQLRFGDSCDNNSLNTNLARLANPFSEAIQANNIYGKNLFLGFQHIFQNVPLGNQPLSLLKLVIPENKLRADFLTFSQDLIKCNSSFIQPLPGMDYDHLLTYQLDEINNSITTALEAAFNSSANLTSTQATEGETETEVEASGEAAAARETELATETATAVGITAELTARLIEVFTAAAAGLGKTASDLPATALNTETLTATAAATDLTATAAAAGETEAATATAVGITAELTATVTAAATAAIAAVLDTETLAAALTSSEALTATETATAVGITAELTARLIEVFTAAAAGLGKTASDLPATALNTETLTATAAATDLTATAAAAGETATAAAAGGSGLTSSQTATATETAVGITAELTARLIEVFTAAAAGLGKTASDLPATALNTETLTATAAATDLTATAAAAGETEAATATAVGITAELTARLIEVFTAAAAGETATAAAAGGSGLTSSQTIALKEAFTTALTTAFTTAALTSSVAVPETTPASASAEGTTAVPVQSKGQSSVNGGAAALTSAITAALAAALTSSVAVPGKTPAGNINTGEPNPELMKIVLPVLGLLSVATASAMIVLHITRRNIQAAQAAGETAAGSHFGLHSDLIFRGKSLLIPHVNIDLAAGNLRESLHNAEDGKVFSDQVVLESRDLKLLSQEAESRAESDSRAESESRAESDSRAESEQRRMLERSLNLALRSSTVLSCNHPLPPLMADGRPMSKDLRSLLGKDNAQFQECLETKETLLMFKLNNTVLENQGGPMDLCGPYSPENSPEPNLGSSE